MAKVKSSPLPTIDFEADAKATAPQVGDNELKTLATAGQELVDAEATVASLEEQLRVAKERVLMLKRQTLPNIMETLGLGEFKLFNGQKVEVRDIIVGALPSKKDDPVAYDKSMVWFRTNAPEVVKTEVGIAFGKGEGSVAKAFHAIASKFAKQKNLVADMDEGVHYQTLQSWLRTRLKAGTVSKIPSTVFASFYMGKEARIIQPKE